MTIDELARRAGTTARNVRALQERRLLPPPTRHGRVGLYGDGHLATLRLIDHLAARGFSQAAIRELLDAWRAGHGIRDVLGLDDALTAIGDPVPVVGAGELAARFGNPPAEVAARAVELGILEPVEGGYAVAVPELADIAAELVDLGIPAGAVVDEAASLLAEIDRVAERFIGLFVEHVADPALAAGAGDEELAELAGKVRAARPLAAKAVDRILARALDRHLADAVARLVDGDGTEAAAG